MATKKKDQKKTVDVSGKNNKVETVVKNFVNAINKSVKKKMSDFNVPIFEVLKDTFSLELYFLNYASLDRLLGNFMRQLDRIVIESIVDTMAEDLVETMDKTSGGYIGIWDNYTVRDMYINTLMVAHDENGYYFTTKGVAKLAAETKDFVYPEESIMYFKDYNPNKFFVFTAHLRKTITTMISNYINNNLPLVFSCGDKPNLNEALYNLFMEFMTVRENTDEQINNTTIGGTDEYIKNFFDIFDRPFLNMVGTILLNCGLSEDLVNETMRNSTFSGVYDDPAKVAIINLTIVYTLRSKLNERNAASISFRIDDMCKMLTTPIGEYPKKQVAAFGKLFKKFILDCCTMVANMNIDLIQQDEMQKLIDSSTDGAEAN